MGKNKRNDENWLQNMKILYETFWNNKIINNSQIKVIYFIK